MIDGEKVPGSWIRFARIYGVTEEQEQEYRQIIRGKIREASVSKEWPVQWWAQTMRFALDYIEELEQLQRRAPE